MRGRGGEVDPLLDHLCVICSVCTHCFAVNVRMRANLSKRGARREGGDNLGALWISHRATTLHSV